MECHLEDWIDPEAAIEGNDIHPDQVGKGQGGCDHHLDVDLSQFSRKTTDRKQVFKQEGNQDTDPNFSWRIDMAGKEHLSKLKTVKT